MEEEEDKASAANSEIRFITLELMKLAQQSGRSFEELARDYLRNGEELQAMLQDGTGLPLKEKRGSVSKQK